MFTVGLRVADAAADGERGGAAAEEVRGRRGARGAQRLVLRQVDLAALRRGAALGEGQGTSEKGVRLAQNIQRSAQRTPHALGAPAAAQAAPRPGSSSSSSAQQSRMASAAAMVQYA